MFPPFWDRPADWAEFHSPHWHSPRFPFMTAWLFDQVEMPVEEDSSLASLSFLSEDQEATFCLHPAGQFLGKVEKLLKCQILRLFLAVAGPCLCLSERHRREDLPWTVRKRPSHHLGCQAILPSSRTLAHTNFFKIKNYVFYWTWSAPFNPLSIGLYVCSLHPLCLAWW